ncbi:MAG: glycosyltransferase, partial [Phycisphaerales bacterium]|nr:glycosyltransferase [Phycisphaerales bacterium]
KGVTLPGLLLESICVLQPMRRLTINPQLVIAESLAAGIATIASDLDSTSEVVQDGVTGRLVPVGDAPALTAALDELLSDRAALTAMGDAAAEDIRTRWSWAHFLDDIGSVYERVTKERLT